VTRCDKAPDHERRYTGGSLPVRLAHVDFLTGREYARKKMAHPDMQSKTRCCPVYSRGGEF